MSDRTRYDIVSARIYTNSNGEERTAWTRLGSAFPTKNNGWALVFDALPLPSINDKGQMETRALIMPPRTPDIDDGIPY